MEPLIQYVLAAVLLVLGLAVVGGALFGRKRKQRLILVAASAILWGSALLLYGCTSTEPPTETPPTPVAVLETVTVMPETATATLVPATAAATLVPTAPPSPLLPSPTPKLTTTVELVQAPPTAGRIAFHSARSGELDIYVMNADGTDLQRLTESPGRDFEPDWSPDGKTIVFSSDRDDPENAQLYVMNSDGSDPKALMPFSDADFIAPRWSPDGEWVLFHSNQAVDGEARFEIYKVRKDGTELTNLSNTPGNNFRGDWSPDGQRIIFVSERDSNRELYVMNADGSNQVRLTDNQADDNRPRWSPDGSKILFEGNRDGDNTALYLMDAPSLVVAGPQEDKIRLLTFPGFNSQAGAWAVDGEKIVLSADRDSDSIQNWDVYIMDADATNIYRLTTDPELDRFPAWTP